MRLWIWLALLAVVGALVGVVVYGSAGYGKVVTLEQPALYGDFGRQSVGEVKRHRPPRALLAEGLHEPVRPGLRGALKRVAIPDHVRKVVPCDR